MIQSALGYLFWKVVVLSLLKNETKVYPHDSISARKTQRPAVYRVNVYLQSRASWPPTPCFSFFGSFSLFVHKTVAGSIVTRQKRKHWKKRIFWKFYNQTEQIKGKKRFERYLFTYSNKFYLFNLYSKLENSKNDERWPVLSHPG